MIRRINIYGGSGVGKSTLAARIFSLMKQRGDNVELVQEFVKQFAYFGQQIKRWDYVYTFAKQLRAEQKLLENGVDVIVTDSPLLLQCKYAKLHNCPVAVELENICNVFDQKFPSFDLKIKRTVDFIGKGRFELVNFDLPGLKVHCDISNERLMELL